MRHFAFLIFFLGIQSSYSADPQITLRGEEAPTDPPWDKGAALAYKHGDGSDTTLFDGVLKVKWPSTSEKEAGLYVANVGLAAYWHKDSSSSKPKDDRGLSVSYGGYFNPDSNPAGAVWNWGWQGKAKFGQTLKSTGSGSSLQTFDADSDRQTLDLQGYFQPAISGSPEEGKTDLVSYYTATTGIYLDNARNTHQAPLDGRVSGVRVQISANYAPLGLDAAENKVTSQLGVVPIIRLSAEYQRDWDASGGREKGEKHLYVVALDFTFEDPSEQNKLIPALTLERSIGADLLTGREDVAITKIALSIKY